MPDDRVACYCSGPHPSAMHLDEVELLHSYDESERVYGERLHSRAATMAARNAALTEYMRHGIYYVQPRRCVLWGGRPSRDLQIGSPEYVAHSSDLDCYAEAMRPRALSG